LLVLSSFSSLFRLFLGLFFAPPHQPMAVLQTSLPHAVIDIFFPLLDANAFLSSLCSVCLFFPPASQFLETVSLISLPLLMFAPTLSVQGGLTPTTAGFLGHSPFCGRFPFSPIFPCALTHCICVPIENFSFFFYSFDPKFSCAVWFTPPH